MSVDKLHLRHIMLYEYNLKKNGTQATNSICFVYEDDALEVRTCQNCVARFSTGDFDINDKERTGRPFEADEDLFGDSSRRRPKKIDTRS